MSERHVDPWAETAPTLDLLRGRTEPLLWLAGMSLSGNEISQFADDLAEYLLRVVKVSAGDRVVCSLANGAELLAAIVAINRIGAIFVPVAPSRRPARLLEIMRLCNPSLVLFSTGAPTFPKLSSPRNLEISVHWSEKHVSVREPGALAPVQLTAPGREMSSQLWRSDREVAAIIFTSGSTGSPKGISLAYSAIGAALASILEYLDIPAAGNILQTSGPSFDYGLYQYFLAAASRCGLVLGHALDETGMEVVLRRGDVTVLPVVPTLARRLLRSSAAPFEAVRIVTTTGSRISSGELLALQQLFPNARIFSMYGLTECKRVSFLDPQLLELRGDSVGKPMPNCEVEIRRPDGSRSEVGEVGELFVAGPHLASGYWNDPEATAASFITDPRSNKTWLRTGDFFHIDDDGLLYFIGRKDDLVKVLDRRISLVSVEEVARKVGGVDEASAWMAEINGVAALHLSYEGTVGERELRSGMLRIVADAAEVPSRITRVATLARSQNGKVIRPSAGEVLYANES